MVKRALIHSLSDIDIRLVRIFMSVTECGGFAASELELNIGRSTISKHISDLELRVGRLGAEPPHESHALDACGRGSCRLPR